MTRDMIAVNCGLERSAMRTLESVVAEIPIFSGLPEGDMTLITGCAANARFSPGELLAREGNQADTFFFLRQGRVALELFIPSRGGIQIDAIEAGEIVGWSWLVPPYRWQFDVRAVESVFATSFDGSCLRSKCDSDPRLGYELMLRFCSIPSLRLRAARLHLAELCGMIEHVGAAP